jgi:hypothetical protein
VHWHALEKRLADRTGSKVDSDGARIQRASATCDLCFCGALFAENKDWLLFHIEQLPFYSAYTETASDSSRDCQLSDFG